MSARFHSAAATHPGLRRAENEDFYVCEPELSLYGTLDGVGGRKDGRAASRLTGSVAVRRVRRQDAPAERRVREALALANNFLCRLSARKPDKTAMACTGTLALLEGADVHIAHVGDTRCYLIRNTGMTQLTEDHSPVGAMLRAGTLSEQQALHHPERNKVYRAIGLAERDPDDGFIAYVRARLSDDSAMLLCSDGLTSLATSVDIFAVVRRFAGDAERVVAELVELALSRGGNDNVTCVYLEGTEFRRAVLSAREPLPAPQFLIAEDAGSPCVAFWLLAALLHAAVAFLIV